MQLIAERKAKLMSGMNTTATSAALLARATGHRAPHCGPLDSDFSQDGSASQPSSTLPPAPLRKEDQGEKLPQLTRDTIDGKLNVVTNDKL